MTDEELSREDEELLREAIEDVQRAIEKLRELLERSEGKAAGGDDWDPRKPEERDK